MGKSELGQKSKPGERGGAYFSFSFVQWNLDITKVLGITNDIFCPSYSIMYGKEPRYNQQNFRITAIRSLSNDDGGVLSMAKKKTVKLNVIVLLP